jgi:K+-sensing histidine kinase KdpD
MNAIRHPTATTYGIVFLSVAAATLITKLLSLAFGFAPIVIFAAAVAFSAILGGFRAGVLSLLLTVIAVNYFFIPPLHALTLAGDDLFRLGAFASAALISLYLRRKHVTLKKAG